MSLKSDHDDTQSEQPVSIHYIPDNTDNEAVLDREWSLAADIFSNLMIRNEILKNLSTPELLTASLVCKTWHGFCREALQKNRHCVAKVQGKCEFEELKEFSALLETSPYIPFNGLTIAIHPSYAGNFVHPDKAEAENIASTIVQRVKVKYLTIRVDGLLDQCNEKCLYLTFLREILRESAGSLEELSFVGDRMKSGKIDYLELIGIHAEGFLLPNVRSLQLPSTFYSLDHYFILVYRDHAPDDQNISSSRKAVLRLINISPKLEELSGPDVTMEIGVLLSRDLARLVTDFHILSSNFHLKGLHKFASSGPKLRSLEFSKELRANGKEQAMKVLKLMLESSKKSLKMFEIPDADLGRIALSWTHIPVLEKVEILRLAVGQIINFWTEGTSALRMLDWSKYFPNVKEICVDYNSRDMPRFETLWDDLGNLSGEHACNSVAKLVFAKPMFFRNGNVAIIQPAAFKKIFPNVKVCWINQSEDARRCMDLSELWSAWPEMQEICIFGLTPSCRSYVDDFMGISDQEAAFLKQYAVEAFESIELVPAKPNILYFKKLRKLVLQFDHGDRSNPMISPEYVFLPPQVCSWILSRMPELVMVIDTYCRIFGNLAGPRFCRPFDTNLDHLLRFGKLVKHNFQPYF